ncbi:MAG: DUF4357 domain-containing protein [Ignavibacterium sp.]|nr:DUF4357 domain-containing protein [Ignavibacterium sp.]
MNIEELSTLAKTDLTNFNGNEQNVKHNIVIRFLACFGYDKYFLGLEHAAMGSRVDVNIGNKILVETKALDKNLDLYVTQVKQYCDNERPDLAILTNGRVFRFYSPFMRVGNFIETLVYEFNLDDFSNEEVAERINKLIGIDFYQNKTYLTYLDERENELNQVRGIFDDHETRNIADIKLIQEDIEQLKSEIATIQSNINLKQQEVEQIKSKRVPEKDVLYKKHFIPKSSILTQSVIVTTPTITKTTIQSAKPIVDGKVYEITKPKKGISASGRYAEGDRFTVIKNSIVSSEVDPTFGERSTKGIYDLRKELENSGIINQDRQFIEDYTFNSISQAAGVIFGGSRNGKIVWE